VTSDIPKTSEICFLLIDRLYILTTNNKHPAATEGGSCVDAKSNLFILLDISIVQTYLISLQIF